MDIIIAWYFRFFSIVIIVIWDTKIVQTEDNAKQNMNFLLCIVEVMYA